MELLKTKCHEILEFESKFYKKNKSHTFHGFSEIKYNKKISFFRNQPKFQVEENKQKTPTIRPAR